MVGQEHSKDCTEALILLCLKSRLCVLCNRMLKMQMRTCTSLYKLEREFVKAFCLHAEKNYKISRRQQTWRNFFPLRIKSNGIFNIVIPFSFSCEEKWNNKIDHLYFTVTLPRFLENLRDREKGTKRLHPNPYDAKMTLRNCELR